MQADPTSKFPFGSVVPLWSRQIPYTMAKFFFRSILLNIRDLLVLFKKSVPRKEVLLFLKDGFQL